MNQGTCLLLELQTAFKQQKLPKLWNRQTAVPCLMLRMSLGVHIRNLWRVRPAPKLSVRAKGNLGIFLSNFMLLMQKKPSSTKKASVLTRSKCVKFNFPEGWEWRLGKKTGTWMDWFIWKPETALGRNLEVLWNTIQEEPIFVCRE